MFVFHATLCIIVAIHGVSSISLARFDLSICHFMTVGSLELSKVSKKIVTVDFIANVYSRPTTIDTWHMLEKNYPIFYFRSRFKSSLKMSRVSCSALLLVFKNLD